MLNFYLASSIANYFPNPFVILHTIRCTSYDDPRIITISFLKVILSSKKNFSPKVNYSERIFNNLYQSKPN
jgi:hypothetical protein